MRAEPHFNSWRNYDSVSPHSKSCRSWTQVFSRRSSKWHRMLQRCLLDVPYHKYHLLLVSGLPGPVRIWLTLISEELQGGLSFTAEAWQQERAVTEPSPSRPGKITPKFHWHNGQNQSGASLCPERWERRWAGSEGEEGCCREITYLHHQLVSVMKKIQLVSDSLLNARSHVMRSVKGFRPRVCMDEANLEGCKHTAEIPLVCRWREIVWFQRPELLAH